MSTKERFIESLQDKLMAFTSKVQSNVYIQAVTHGMMGAMGVLIGGSIVNLVVNLPIPGWAGVLQTLGIYDLLTMVVKVFQLTAALMCFNIGFSLAKFKNVNQLQAGVISFMCFFLTVPVFTSETGTEMIQMTYLNAQNICTAIVTGLAASSLFCFITNKKIVIKMPASVPEFVSSSLSAIPAGLLTVIPFIALRGILATTAWGAFPDMINALIALPLQSLGNNLFGHMAFLLFSSLAWWFGIHNMPILVVASIIMGPAATENVNAVMSGLAIPNMLSWTTFLIPLQLIGGSGAMLGLYLDTVLFAKSERYKTQGKIQLVPGLFNITEPAMFGMPTVLNVNFLIPLVMAPQAIMLMLYFCLKMGLFKTPTVAINNYLPGALLGPFMGGGIALAVFMVAASLVSCLIYYPFVKIADKKALEEEQALIAEE